MQYKYSNFLPQTPIRLIKAKTMKAFIAAALN